MKHLTTMMAVFLLMGCNVTDNIPNQTAPDIKVKAVHLIKDEDKEPKKPSPDDFNFISVPKTVQCAPGNQLLKNLMDVKEIPLAIWTDAFHGNQVIVFTNQESGSSTIIEYPPMFEGKFACVLSVGVQTIISYKPKTQGIKIKYLTN